MRKRIVFYVMVFLVALIFLINPNEVKINVKASKPFFDVYMLAVNMGYDGSYEEWESINKNQDIINNDIECIIVDNFIKWRNVDDVDWNNLITIDKLIDYRNEDLKFQVANNHLQYKYNSDTWWSNLLMLDKLIDPFENTNREVIFEINEGYLKWKYVNDSNWKNLIEIASITRSSNNTKLIYKMENGYIKWQEIGDSIWHNLIEISLIECPKYYSFYDLYLLTLPINNKPLTQEEWVKILQNDDQINTVIFKGLNDQILDVKFFDDKLSIDAPKPPEIKGYQFLGWDKLSSHIIEDTEINAIYQPIKYKITFDSNGGNVIEPVIKEFHSKLDLPIPVKVGYDFIGWYDGLDIESKEFTNSHVIEEDLYLFAKWKIKEYKVTFKDYDDNIINVQYVKHGYGATQPYIPKRTGYTFKSWNNSFDNITSDILIKADYEINQYTITFNTNGGIKIDPMIVNYNNTIKLPIPSRENYVFLGWNSDENETSKELIVTKDVTLDAKWTRLKYYNIYFNVNGGSHVESINVGCYSLITILPTSTKENFIFNGWKLNDELITLPLEYKFNEDIILNASWKAFYQGFAYEIQNNEITILSYDNSDIDVIIPDTIDNLPVTSIGDNAFKNNNNIKSITFGESIINVGDNAFEGCINLTNVYMNSKIINLGNSVFVGCDKLETITLSSQMPYELKYLFGDDEGLIPKLLKKIKYANSSDSINTNLLKGQLNDIKIELADDMYVIPNNLFRDCTGLTNIIIPSAIKIGNYSFSGCSSLTSVKLPLDIEVIGDYAFYDCRSLNNINVPDSVDIGDYAFINCNYIERGSNLDFNYEKDKVNDINQEINLWLTLFFIIILLCVSISIFNHISNNQHYKNIRKKIINKYKNR